MIVLITIVLSLIKLNGVGKIAALSWFWIFLPLIIWYSPLFVKMFVTIIAVLVGYDILCKYKGQQE